MNLRIPIPQILVRASNRFGDWGNAPVFERTLHVPIRLVRIDLVCVASFVFCVTYYFWLYGWRGALQGGAMFIFLSLVALWFLRPPAASPPTPASASAPAMSLAYDFRPRRLVAARQLESFVGTDRVVRINVDGVCVMRVRLGPDCKVEVRRPHAETIDIS